MTTQYKAGDVVRCAHTILYLHHNSGGIGLKNAIIFSDGGPRNKEGNFEDGELLRYLEDHNAVVLFNTESLREIFYGK